MKKIFFAAVVAIVAVGGAFASKPTKNASPRPVYDRNTCEEILYCTSQPGMPACTVLANPADYVGPDCDTPEGSYARDAGY
ncbi:hypothetical protein FBD94_09895 [Pedobacter hiemivivus]|uniref:Uncharacterized protein n=1 Tax=Pedobacter hiemivivus TaxID=2530454 RepID=A0A4V5PCY8_9SPHI|nr:DUF6520 family protein [Pedobacter hiemivivus]TKC62516.1 hypothetical protein FBD94_09895 [Pedobacter hiemivivus]